MTMVVQDYTREMWTILLIIRQKQSVISQSGWHQMSYAIDGCQAKNTKQFSKQKMGVRHDNGCVGLHQGNVDNIAYYQTIRA